jgi:hypothetical protein
MPRLAVVFAESALRDQNVTDACHRVSIDESDESGIRISAVLNLNAL